MNHPQLSLGLDKRDKPEISYPKLRSNNKYLADTFPVGWDLYFECLVNPDIITPILSNQVSSIS